MEQEQPQQQPDYKTRTIAPDERHLILLVLDESVNIGKRFEFEYDGMNDIHHMALAKLTHMGKALEQKKALFDKLDQRSYTYNRILNVAKLALRELQDNTEYSYYSADLIYKFLQLEDVFGERNLKSVKVEFHEVEPTGVVLELGAKEAPIQVPSLDEGELIPENLGQKTMKAHKRKLAEAAELGGALADMDFTEDEVIIEDEQVNPEEIKGMDFTD